MEQKRIVPSIPIDVKIITEHLTFTIEDLEKIKRLRGDYGVVQFKKRLEQGDVLFAAYHENSLAGFGWLQFAPGTEAGYQLPIATAYSYDAWIFDEFRGNRVFPLLKQEYSHYLKTHHPEITQTLAHIAIRNKSSIKANLAAGAHISGIDLAVIFLGYNRRFKFTRSY